MQATAADMQHENGGAPSSPFISIEPCPPSFFLSFFQFASFHLLPSFPASLIYLRPPVFALDSSRSTLLLSPPCLVCHGCAPSPLLCPSPPARRPPRTRPCAPSLRRYARLRVSIQTFSPTPHKGHPSDISGGRVQSMVECRGLYTGVLDCVWCVPSPCVRCLVLIP